MPLEIVMFPWLAFGHLNPFFELSKGIAERGHHISFISTPRNIKRLPKLPQNLASNINFVDLKLPLVENLPPHAEASSDLPREKVAYLKAAFDGLESALASYLEKSPPDWIIHDYAPHWLPPIAAKLNIPCVFFYIFNAEGSLGFFESPSTLLDTVNDLGFQKFEIARLMEVLFSENESGFSDDFRFQTAFKTCTILAIRSCTEHEEEPLKLLQDKLHGKPVLPVGLLPPQVVGTDEEDQECEEIKEWLDKQQAHSVVYVALGTEASLNQQETAELAHGLELSKLPFFWVLRIPAGSTQKVELPTGFEERVKGRGFVWRSWVPQIRVLSHLSIGGSLTHCGWSSVIESLAFGHPLLMLPMVNDQAFMAKLLERQKVGLRIPRNAEDGSITRELVAESLRKVMVEKEGEKYKSIAKDVSKLFGDKLRQDCYVDDFIHHLNQHRLNLSV